MKFFRLALLVLVFSLAGCDQIAKLVETPVATSLPLTPTSAVSSATPAATLPAGEDLPPTLDPDLPVTLHLWVPPVFDPAAGTPEGDVLLQRLQAFERANPNTEVEVRVKAQEGDGSLLDSLATASAAAPLALPDLTLLSRPQMETAALKGLLYPLNGLSDVLEEPDWYDFARELAGLQNRNFGVPFAGDAMLLVYRPALVEETPRSLDASLEAGQPLLFPAADPQALFTLAQYQSAGGAIQDDQGRPSLNNDVLTELLTVYAEAEHAGVMPFWLTQYGSDEQVWDAFGENQADMVVTWASQYLNASVEDLAAAPLPTLSGQPFTLSTGWVLAVATPRPERQILAARLAEFLTEPEFLADWNRAAGYIPPRPSALQGWDRAELKAVLDRVARSATLQPSTDILISVGPALSKATVAVLKEESDPAVAAKTASSGLLGP